MRQPDDYTEDDAAYYAYQQEIEKLQKEIAQKDAEIIRLKKDLSDWNDDFGGL